MFNVCHCLFFRQNDGETLNNIKKNASVAMQLALR